MDTSGKIQKVVRRASLQEQPEDVDDWQKRSYQARLATLEQIRQEYHQWRYGSQPRFQKFHQIVKR